MKNAVLLLLVFLSFGLANANTSQTTSTIAKEILPTDDTYVFGRGGNEVHIIRGLEDRDCLKSYYHPTSRSWAYETYLKFDLSAIINNPDLITNVKLRLYGSDNKGSNLHTIDVYQMSGTQWSEDDLTYYSIATTGDKTKLTSIENVSMTTDKWYEWDITEAVKANKANNNNTLCLMLCDNIRFQDVIVSFHSRENISGNGPRLVVEEEDVSELLLSEINIDGNLLASFQPTTFGYTVYLSPNVTTVPSVTAAQVDNEANLQITQAANLIGTLSERTAEIKISKNGKELIYLVTFEQVPLNNNTSLSNLSVDGKTIEFFTSTKRDYTYYLPYSHNPATMPNVGFDGNNPNQQITFLPASNLSGSESERTAMVRIKSGDETITEDYTVTFEILPELDLYLCIGQSNMSGRGYMREDLGDFEPIDNTYLLTPELKWEIATNPLNKYSSKRKELSLQRIGPPYGFAITVNKEIENPIGLVVNALGGSSMTQWTKGNAEGLYEAALVRAKDAQKWGRIKAILWHQGSSDLGDTAFPLYPERLRKMVDNYRADLNEPDLYFVAGELCYWRTDRVKYNEMIRTISSFIPNSDYVSAEGLTPLINDADPHFDRESNIELGRRYAEKVLEKIYGAGSGIEDAKIEQTKIYTDKKKVIIQNDSSDATVQIFDVTGRKIIDKKINADTSIDILNRGIYIVLLSSNNQIVKKKVLIQ